jgi:hypothetical protein
MRGTAKRNRQQVQDELDRLKARVNVGGGVTAITATIETVRENLPAVLRLVAEILREPAFPESEFEQIRKLMLTSVDNAKSEPQVLAQIGQTALRPHPKATFARPRRRRRDRGRPESHAGRRQEVLPGVSRSLERGVLHRRRFRPTGD